MSVQNLTTAFLSTLDSCPAAAGRIEYCDTELPGFFLEYRTKGKGTYYFRYRNRGSRARQMRLGKLGEISLADARAKAYRLHQQVSAGENPQHQGSGEMPSLAQFVREHYLPYAKDHKRSWSTDETLLRLHLLPVFGEKPLDQIQRQEIATLHRRLKQQGYAAGTCNRILVLLRFLFNCARRWDILPATTTNPCSGIPAFADRGARERYLSDAEVKRLLTQLDKSRHQQVARIVKLLLYTGARRSEIVNARWEYIDLEQQVLTVPLSKSGKPRHIALPDAAVKLLREIPRQADVPWVFHNPKTGKPLVSFYCAWNSLRKAAAIPDVRLHDLRHSFASFLVRSGRSLYEVQKLLGHYDPKVTMRYAHLSPRSLVDAANIAAQIIGG
ncbi:tyrosine-type recombinase/integrase [Trichloromonas sp.]|uniref:tyrosine-type recombinase/integrase n=1 Tax=Trichloromonas sp. TaxID=3069249 RepID=UPI001D879198|nr:tyrosine-type recombinase/integrase [Desulfuromonadaceae bacterium]MDY0269077.1 tyrosine-type recombinase/integrase [Trichloromonas sp.]